MPQAFIYLIAFCISVLLRFSDHSLDRLLNIVEGVCLGGIVLFSILEIYQDTRSASPPSQRATRHASSE